MLFKCLVKKQDSKPLSLKDFHARRNKVLIRRRTGGLGDIIMHRMLFEDFHRIMPDIKLTFACPIQYLGVISDHPYLASCVDFHFTNNRDFGVVYDTTTRCRVYEAMTAPNCNVHRSDIWANSCGVTLQKHDMHVTVPPEYMAEGKKMLGTGKPTVLFVPFTSNGTEKNLTHEQVTQTIKGLQKRGYLVVGLHDEEQELFNELGCKSIITKDLMTWKTIIACVDAVVTIDTAVFHMAGGMKKPMVGIFSWTNGKVYGKHFKFMLVQKHRDDDKTWCGPCGNWGSCPKVNHYSEIKPCVTELRSGEILEAFDRITCVGSGKTSAVSVALPVIELPVQYTARTR